MVIRFRKTYNSIMKKLKLAQITDIHIGPKDELYSGIDVRARFMLALNYMQEFEIDYIVVSGDLAIDFGEIEAYEWIYQQLESQPIPYIVMAGNHDSVERMNKVFDLEDDIQEDMLFFKKELKGFPIYFLDSEPDWVATQQLDWLVNETDKDPRPSLLFMHHPPALSGCQFMDRKYPLRNIPEVQKSLKLIENIKDIFVGHYHTDKVVRFADKRVYITPATQMRISETNPDFEMVPQGAGWRYIEWDGETLLTECKYAPNSVL